MPIRVKAKHGIIYREEKSYLGYFGWPTVARQPDGTVVVVASGFRHSHICPWGQTVLFRSRDEGRTWSAPDPITSTPLDDRDAGVLALGGKALLVSWFVSDIRHYLKHTQYSAAWKESVSLWDEDVVERWDGSWTRLSFDGQTWQRPNPSPLSTPHGPILLKNKRLLYFGKRFAAWKGPKAFRRTRIAEWGKGGIEAALSADRGKTWKRLGGVPLPEGLTVANTHEPHAVEMPDGRLLGLIRVQDYAKKDKDGDPLFTMYQTESRDGGSTWSEARPTGVAGSPPHLLLHSSGEVVNVYGYRKKPYGERAMVSRDGGETWQADLVLRADGPSSDLGYPSSVELPDRSILTVYYQQCRKGEPCSLLWTRWKLPS